MSENLAKKAAEMLLKGATLLSEPCPYCKGVRVIKDGHALCTSCGREPEKREIPNDKVKTTAKSQLEAMLEKKMQSLSKDLEKEKDHKKQQEILKSINSVLETLDKVKEK